MTQAVKELGKVAVLMGGRSAEREISLMSGKGVLAALQSRGVDAHGFDTGLRSLSELEAEKFDRAFIVLHGRYGEDGTIQGVLEMLNIPYTGSGVMAAALTMNKVKTKQVWQAQGLPTPAFVVLDGKSDFEAVACQLGLPLIVKPAHEGSTFGLTRVKHASELQAAYEKAAQLDALVLAEECIVGRELTISILGEGETARALPLTEVVTANGGVYEYEDKYFTDVTRYHTPAVLDAATAERVAQLSVQSYRATECAGWGRVDVMLRATDNQPFLLEVNSAPGMTGHSLVPMAAKAAGMSYEEVCLEILRSARLKIQAGRS